MKNIWGGQFYFFFLQRVWCSIDKSDNGLELKLCFLQGRFWFDIEGSSPTQLPGHSGGLLQRTVAQLSWPWGVDD